MALVLNDKELRRELKALDYTAGPITDSTRSLYVKKLKQLRSEKSQKEQSSRALRSRPGPKQRKVDSRAPAYPEQLRKRPGAASSTRADLNRASQADSVSVDDPPTDYTETSADYFTDGLHTVDDGYAGKSDSLSSHRYTGTLGSLYSDPYAGTSGSLSSDPYTWKSDSLYSEPYKRKSDSLYSDAYTRKSDSLYSDPYTRKSDSLNSDPYTRKSDSLNSDPYTRKSDSLNSDPYTRTSDSLSSDPYTRKSDRLYSDRYARKSDSLYSDPYTRKSDSLYSDPYTRKSDSLYSDPYTRKSDSLSSDRYTRKSDSLSSDRYAGILDSLSSDQYVGKSDSLSSDQYAVKYQKADPYTRKSDRLYSDRYAGISDSLSSDRYTGRFNSLHSDQFTKNSGSLYSYSHYRGKAESLSENEHYTSQTPAGLPKTEVQKHKNRLDKFEFYLSQFLYISTIVLCLVLMGLIFVKTLGLVEGSQEDIGENIKMLPVDCSDKTDAFCQAEEHKIIMRILSELYEYLAETAGEFECGSESPLKSKCVPVTDVKRHLAIFNVPNLEKFNEALQWIIQSTRDLGIRLIGEDSEAAVTSVDQVTCLESTRPQMNFYCRLRITVFTILHRMLIFIWGRFDGFIGYSPQNTSVQIPTFNPPPPPTFIKFKP
ncbi:inner nuclear membrane protein Man1-like isoform X2 [Heterodontus francisci]|uniref:inner nuclear membrane protein Man1-like isoform X2 n=1 Tax=Heterodontus francisci TaxID=7792 RepID=UPI00355B8056